MTEENEVGEAIAAVATSTPDDAPVVTAPDPRAFEEAPFDTPSEPDAEPAPAADAEPATDAEPAPEPVAPYEAQIIDPPAEDEPQPDAAAEPEETPLEIPEGFAAVRYLGAADAFEYGAYTFRGDKPVAVPSEIAEELLTFPFERFERL